MATDRTNARTCGPLFTCTRTEIKRGGVMNTTNVKHAPATALPWSNAGHRNAVDLGREQSLHLNRWGDADYIVHAANAYPRLVKELRNLREQVECMNAQQAFGRDYEEAVVLLRELGEAV